MNTFAQDIKDLTEVTVARAQEAIAKQETATFFIGRKTCPYCRRFAAKLAKVLEQTGAQVYFINSEKTGQEQDLAAFRSAYGIRTVPGFVRIKDGQVSVRCDSSMTEEEIKAFAEMN